jgi:hypothetical protein
MLNKVKIYFSKRWYYFLSAIIIVYYIYHFATTVNFMIDASLQCYKRNYFMLEAIEGHITAKQKTLYGTVVKVNGNDLNASILQYNPSFYDVVNIGDSIAKKRCETIISIITQGGQIQVYDANYECTPISCDSLKYPKFIIK